MIGVGEQKPDWSRLKRECGETNCNEEKGKERNEAVAVGEVRSGVALKKLLWRIAIVYKNRCHPLSENS